MMLAGIAQAQQTTSEPEAASAPVVVAPAEDKVTTLGEVRAIKPEDDQPLDLYRFKSPIRIENNRFSRDWREPPTPEQVSMAGGYVMMGIVYGLVKAGKGLNTLTGGPDQIQSAVARPPPQLNAEQQRRALQFCAQQDGCDVPPAK